MKRFTRAFAVAMIMTVSLAVGATPGPFRILAQGTQSGIEDARNVVIEDAQAFRSLWSAHAVGAVPMPAPPDVDFAAETVIAAFAGVRDSGGYGISVAGMEEREGRLEVNLMLSRPGPGCMVAQVLTQPHVWAAIRKTALPVAFHTATRVNACGDTE